MSKQLTVLHQNDLIFHSCENQARSEGIVEACFSCSRMQVVLVTAVETLTQAGGSGDSGQDAHAGSACVAFRRC